VIRAFSLLFISLFLFSCKTNTVVKFSNEESAIKKLYAIISECSVDYSWYSAKVRVQLVTPEINAGGRMNIRMIKDSLIWFNFKKLSIEGARGQITSDSFCILYRFEKMFEKGNLRELMEYYNLPLTFSELQLYIAGNIPKPIESTLRYRHRVNRHYLYGSNDLYNLNYSFDEYLNLTAFSITDAQNRKLNVELKNKDEEKGIYLRRKLFFAYDEKNVGILEMIFSNIEINVPKNIRFSIPSNYTEY